MLSNTHRMRCKSAKENFSCGHLLLLVGNYVRFCSLTWLLSWCVCFSVVNWYLGRPLPFLILSQTQEHFFTPFGGDGTLCRTHSTRTDNSLIHQEQSKSQRDRYIRCISSIQHYIFHLILHTQCHQDSNRQERNLNMDKK